MENYTEAAENKIIILYALEKAGPGVIASGFINALLRTSAINYFSLQESLAELIEDGQVKGTDTDGSAAYEISDRGRKMIELFESKVPKGIKKRILEEMREISHKRKLDSSVFADYREIDIDTFEVALVIRERNADLMDLRILVGSKIEAMKICNDFKISHQSLYEYIMRYFTKKNEG